MPITSVLAQAVVTDLDRALVWYGRLFGRKPDANPMEGLHEWHFGSACGVQVWSEPDRAGHATIVLAESDLEALAAHVGESGLGEADIEQLTASRALQLSDPDGNRLVFTGA